MRRILRRIADAMRRWVSEADRAGGSDSHVGQKAEDESGFGRITGAERRRPEHRRRDSGPARSEDETEEGR